mgnify:CR=1 FL=1
MSCLPIGRGARTVVAIERVRIVLALVAEKRAELVKTTGAFDEHHPVEVAALVAEMAEQRAVRLAELLALALALDGVGLQNVDRDDAVEMAGRGIDEKVEGKTLSARGSRVERQAEAQQ